MRIGGTCYLRINGKLYTLGDGDFSFGIGGFQREAKLSRSGVAGYTEKAQAPFIDGELLYVPDLELAELFDLTEATVSLELANGKTFVLHNAWYAGESEVSTDGTIKVKFNGIKGEIV